MWISRKPRRRAGVRWFDTVPGAVGELLEDRLLLSVDVVVPLQTLENSGATGEKPQSKLWEHDGTFWAVLEQNGRMDVMRLDELEWTSVLTLSSGVYSADVKVDGNVAHILLEKDDQSLLASIQYTGSGMYEFWETRPQLVSVPIAAAAETATIDIDSTGRMWTAYDNSGKVEVRYSDGNYQNWSGPIVLEQGITSDDITALIAMPNGTIGVLWSNQNTRRFGFRVHIDGTAPDQWLADEVPASQSALNLGGGMADDHLNLAVGADSTLYAAVKTGYDSGSAPAIALLVRRPHGTWDDLYAVDNGGTRPIVQISDTTDTLIVAYRNSNSSGPIQFRESRLSAIAFGAEQTAISASSANNVSGMKASFSHDVPLVAGSSSRVYGVGLRTSGSSSGPVLVTVLGGSQVIVDGDSTPSTADNTNFGNVLQGSAPVTRTYQVRNDGEQSVTLTGLSVPAGFSVLDGLADSLAPGAIDTIVVRLETSASGVKAGEIRFTINGSIGNPFNFAVTGTVTPVSVDVVYVNDDFTGPAGTWIADADRNSPGDQPAIIGTNAFSTIQAGVDAVRANGTVLVTDDLATDGPGRYVENVVIGKHLMIRASEGVAAAVVVDGGRTGSVFEINNFSVELTALLIENGAAINGGGVINYGGTVTINDSIIRSNSASERGGGIANGGTLVLNNTQLSDNFAGLDGGGLFNAFSGSVALDSVVVERNVASRNGGGLWNSPAGTLEIGGGTAITDNHAEGGGSNQGGGGVFNWGRLIVDNAIIDGNRADGAAGSGGGLLLLAGVSSILNATISNNLAQRAGGGIAIVNGELTTSNMILIANGAGGSTSNSGDGGGLHVSGTNNTRVTIEGGVIAGNTATRSGGGLWHQTGSLMIVYGGTTIDGNVADGQNSGDGGGGIFNNGGRLAFKDVTISNNQTEGSGGGVLSLGGLLSIDNATVSQNNALAMGGGIVSQGELRVAGATVVANRSYAESPGGAGSGGIHNGGVATLNNTIIVGNLSGLFSSHSDLGGNALRAVSTYNLIGDANSAGGLNHGSNGNIVGSGGSGTIALATVLDPMLADNGGLTLTHALVAGSPAIDAGNNSLARDARGVVNPYDQRGTGFDRINNGTVDIGAFES